MLLSFFYCTDTNGTVRGRTYNSRPTKDCEGEKEMTRDEIKKWLKENESEQEALLKELKVPITAEQVTAFLETEGGKAIIQPVMDSRVTEAIKTYKAGHFDKELKAAVATELLKINPTETSEQKQIRELVENQNTISQKWEHEKLQGQIKELAFSQGVKLDFIGSLPFNSIEEAALYIRRYKQEQEDIRKAAVNELLVAGSYKPGSGDDGKGGMKIDLSKLSQEELIKMEEDGTLDDSL